MDRKEADYLIIGAGIIGLTLAYAIKNKKPTAKIVIIDKESHEAFHASGRNSGILHAGIYYNASSLKARFCLEGNRALRNFCATQGLPINECGKLIVPTSKEELPRLDELYTRATTIGTPVSLVDESEARRIEPNVSIYEKAIFSPLTASVDPQAVCKKIVQILSENNVKILFDTLFLKTEKGEVVTSKGIFSVGTVINAAGLYADSVAHQYGFGLEYGILPFKGLYLKYGKNKTDVRTNIYPVPDPRFPFLGVHFTKTVDNSIKIGPTAMPAFWREQYSGFDRFSFPEFQEIILREAKLFCLNTFNFRDLAFVEFQKYFRSYFISLAKKLVPTIDVNGFTEFTKPGIRAQLVHKKSGELVQDFVVQGDSRSVHILNAVSPGFTCSFAFAEYVISEHLKS